MKDDGSSGEVFRVRYPHCNAWTKAWIAAGALDGLNGRLAKANGRSVLTALADAIDNDDGYVYTSQRKMAAAWDIGEKTFRRYVDHFEAKGVIKPVPHYRANGSQTTDRIYLLPAPDVVQHPSAPLDKMLSSPPGQDAVQPRLAPDSPPQCSAPPEPSHAADAAASASDGVPDRVPADLPEDARGGETDVDDYFKPPRGTRECTYCGEFKAGCSWSPDGLAAGWWCARCVEEVEEELQARAVAVEPVAAGPADEVREDEEAAATDPQRRVDAAEVPAGAAADVGRGGVLGGDGGGSLGHEPDSRSRSGSVEDDGIPF